MERAPMKAREIRNALVRPWRHGEHCDLREIRVDEKLDLSGTTLRGFDVTGARFAGEVTARRATFRGLTWFKQCRFDAPVGLGEAVFRHDCRMDEIRCPALDLSGAVFEGVLCLDGAEIGTLNLRGVLCLANVSLSGARIGKLDLSGGELMGGIWARSARIEAAEFSDLHAEGRQSRL